MKGVVLRIFRVITIFIYLSPVLLAGTIISDSYNTSKPITSAWIWCQYDNKSHEVKPTSSLYSISDQDACDICHSGEDKKVVRCDFNDLDDGSYKVKEINYKTIDKTYIYSAIGVLFVGWLVIDFILAIIFYIIEGKFTFKKGIYFKIFKLFSRKK